DQLRVPLIVFSAGLIPTSLMFIVGYFRHKRQEIELERELRKQEITHGAGALETRVRALEAAVQQLAATSPYLSAPPRRETAGEDPSRAPGSKTPSSGT